MAAIFYAPHPDDENLWTNLAIARAVHDDALDVHVVLMTNTLGAQWPQLATGTGGACSIGHNTTHNFGWTKAQYHALRDAEFTRGCLALGVSADNIHIAAGRSEDFGLTVQWAMGVMAAFEATYPGSRHSATSWQDSHPEHRALALALHGLAHSGGISEARWYLRTEFQAANDGIEESGSSTALDAASDGPATYAVWDPDNQRYAMAYHSVKSLLDDQIAAPHNKWHTIGQNR